FGHILRDSAAETPAVTAARAYEAREIVSRRCKAIRCSCWRGWSGCRGGRNRWGRSIRRRGLRSVVRARARADPAVAVTLQPTRYEWRAAARATIGVRRAH